MITSAPIARSSAITLSGVNARVEPSMCDWNVTPSSETVRSPSSENTWKPPESVSIGPSHAMNLWMPPISRITSSPGRRCRWYALARIICAPIARSSSGSSDFTVAPVPTAMNAGVSTSPCGVRKTPNLARPLCARTVNGNAGLLTGAPLVRESPSRPHTSRTGTPHPPPPGTRAS